MGYHMNKKSFILITSFLIAACNSSSPQSDFQRQIKQINKEQQRDNKEFAKFAERNPDVLPKYDPENNNRIISGNEQVEMHDRVVSAMDREAREQTSSTTNAKISRASGNKSGYNNSRSDWKLIKTSDFPERPEQGVISSYYDQLSLKKSKDTVRAWCTHIPVPQLMALLDSNRDRFIAEANERRRDGYTPPEFQFEKGSEKDILNTIVSEVLANHIGTYSRHLLEMNCVEGKFRILKKQDYENGYLIATNSTADTWQDASNTKKTMRMLCK